MKERPILFNGEMVRAVLDGRKTATRRVVEPQPEDVVRDNDDMLRFGDSMGALFYDICNTGWTCPYGAPGDRLCWTSPKPSIHMPRWASRINLEVAGVRVERVQEITEEDAKAEGAEPSDFSRIDPDADFLFDIYPIIERENPYRTGFALLWDSINGKPRKDGTDISWAANPWVWVVEFKRIEESV